MVAISLGISVVLAFAQASAAFSSEFIATAVAFNERVVDPTVLHASHEYRRMRRATAFGWEATHQGLRQKIDRAVAATASKPHYFWTGFYKPGPTATNTSANSVMNHAFDVAIRKGGTTLEQTVEKVGMPGWGQDADTEDIWNYASDAYAFASKGDVYVVRGEIVRGGNVWVAFEYKRLKTMTAIKRILEIKTFRTGDNPAKQVWPDAKGCAGVSLLDTTIKCPPSSPLYYSAPGPKSPMVRADTTVAKDATIKVARGGSAPGIKPECTEILRGEWVMEQFNKRSAKICQKLAASKTDGAKVMNDVKKLLEGSSNRHFIQEQRLSKNKEKVTGHPIPRILEQQLLDSLVSISYYEKTHSQTAAILKSIDDMVGAVAGVSPGLTAAWATETAIQKTAKPLLLKDLLAQIAQKKKEAAEAAKRAACGNTKPGPKRSLEQLRQVGARSGGVYSGAFAVSPIRRTSLEKRVQKTRQSGPKSPAAPSCPLKNAPQKKVVPRNKVKTKQTPAVPPRRPAKTPAKRPPNNKKKVVPRPANRARRAPGKPKPTRRTTPKRKPKKAPKPTRRPKGKARARKTRRK
ncbi:hypothetical protein BKA62DRAFT_273142 [Auriculariales sp. MPI-PUGE-AT-0066]|nr:hypothetical protein BKA62DRAFT_273142 [Auriculariales sp. MPI-PUGE-AT-0066]